MDNFEEFVPNVHFELIPIKNLVPKNTHGVGYDIKGAYKRANRN